MATEKNTLKNWFRTGLKPTQSQFWAWLDSYWHKDEKIPLANIDGMDKALENKAETSALDGKANIDGSGLGAENIIKWKEALGMKKLAEKSELNEEKSRIDALENGLTDLVKIPELDLSAEQFEAFYNKKYALSGRENSIEPMVYFFNDQAEAPGWVASFKDFVDFVVGKSQENSLTNPKFVDFVRQNAVEIKNILENIETYRLTFNNNALPGKIIFYVENKKIEAEGNLVWHITDYQSIIFKWEDYNDGEITQVRIENSAGVYFLSEENPIVGFPEINGGASYGDFHIEEI